MKNFVSCATALAVALSASPAWATLKDHGPLDPVVTFPIWYRDLDGVAVQQCRSTTQSPNAAAGFAAMCFPIVPDPTGFAGNLGGELFYTNANTAVAGPGFTLKYVSAMEMAYLSATGAPVRGQEIVFSRLRIVMTTTVPGTYKVTHPYGVEVFPDVGTGPRALFWTEDVTPIPGNFDAALAGRVGPYLQWDFLQPGESLSVVNAAGQTESFLGDPNYLHTFTGSPFGTNYVRVDGPPGSNLDGAGNDFMQTPLMNVLGQSYLAPIPSPLTIKRASYSRDAVSGIGSVDVWATALPNSKLLLTGTDLPSVIMKGDGLGNYMAHIEVAVGAPLPNFVSLTNMNDNPATTKTATLADVVTISNASFDTLTNALSVAAVSSDASAATPALVVEGPFGGLMAAGAYSIVIPNGIPPQAVSVVSGASGHSQADVLVIPGLPDNKPFPPVAVPDSLNTPSNVAGSIDLAANDAVTPPATAAAVLVVTAPTHGTVVPAAVGGLVTYTPGANYAGPDAFEYVLQDSLGNVSNVAAVTVTVTFVAQPPTAFADNWAQVRNTARAVNVLANDKATLGTLLDPASIVIAVAPLHGTAVANANGTITYTPFVGYVGADGFGYTVKNNAGLVSNVATEFVSVTPTLETLSFSRTDYRVSTAQWNIVGSTNVFGVQLTQTTVTCYLGVGLAGAPIGTVQVDTAGRFTLVTTTGPVPPNPGTFTCQSSNGGVRSAAVTRR